MAEAQLTFEDAKGGMNAFDPPHKIATNQLARLVNCEIRDGLPTTRPGGRVVPFTAPDAYRDQAAFQGAIFYNPAKGQGGIQFAASNASLAVGIAGRMYLITLQGRHFQAKAQATDVTGGLEGHPQHHLVWLSQWEDLLVRADGAGKTWIYNPGTGASYSRGYDTVDKLASEIPNGATVLAYAHGRGIAVINSRWIIVGDSLHRTNQTASVNLRQFTEQVHWATGQYFVPPSSMGGINAAAILPLMNTAHGHSDVFFHCEDGIFSVDVSQYPRQTWADKALVRHALLQAGATGPYAIAVKNGDQIYRTRMGAQTLRSAAAQAALEGDPEQTISAEVDTWMQADYPRWLRFAFVTAWGSMRKVFFSVAPIVQGSFRWHRGVVVRNTDVALTQPGTPAIWEGLWTLPPQCKGIVQMVSGIFDGQERAFAWTRGADKRNRLVEFSEMFREDILEDGTRRPIRCAAITRAIDAGKWWETREYHQAHLYLRNVSGLVRWGVWFRNAESAGWKFLRAGTVEVIESVEPFQFFLPDKRSANIPLGKIPDDCQKDADSKANETRSIQFLVRWEGYCSFEGVRVEHGVKNLAGTDLDREKLRLVFRHGSGEEYSDFEYSETDEPLWITDENERC